MPTQCWLFISRYHMFAKGQSPTLSQHQVNIKRRFAFDRSEWKGNNRVHQGFWLTLRHHQSWDEHCTEDQAAYILIHLPLHIAPQRVIAYHCTCFPHRPSFCIALSHIAVTHKPTVCFSLLSASLSRCSSSLASFFFLPTSFPTSFFLLPSIFLFFSFFWLMFSLCRSRKEEKKNKKFMLLIL